MSNNLKYYVDKFNSNDNESVINLISNKNAYKFLSENAPILTCPDKDIEETFAFRTWVFRKHLKETEDGLVITEFLPNVPWAGKHNTINAPLFFHLNEGRWFKNASNFLSYPKFFLNQNGNAYDYTTPALTAIVKFFKNCDNIEYLLKNINTVQAYYDGWDLRYKLKNGLYKSNDGIDAMELSISGRSVDGNTRYEGIRPTLNTYMYLDTLTLASLYKLLGDKANYDKYKNRANELKSLINTCLYDGDFYKAIHLPNEQDLEGEISCKDILPENNVRELIGFIPFKSDIISEEKLKALDYLFSEKHFLAPNGFTTADIENERFLYNHPHECKWNGYVWPFATSQVIESLIEVYKNYGENYLSSNDLYSSIKTYAKMHYLYKEDKKVNWIDEVMHPFEPKWTAKEQLLSINPTDERGKDYNHSSFIDLVIRGLIGVNDDFDNLTVTPTVLDKWDYFRLENLNFKGKSYTIVYDKTGTHFNEGKGITIIEQ